MKISDEQERKDILASKENIVVSASAGSGKTTIMIEKMVREMAKVTNHQRMAAITFTIKATEEIKKKASSSNNQDIIIMTNDSFVEYEIIRPFLRDAFGKCYSKNFLMSYNDKFLNFEEGLNCLREKNILGVYKNNHRNFKFYLAREILINSSAAREYLRYKYIMLFLDEYQDSDIDMHNLFMYIKNELLIKLFIVGDTKQAIYLWRGAQNNIFDLLDNEGIERYELIHNFRSDPEIVNYANCLHNNKNFNYVNNEVERVIICNTNDYIESFKDMCDSGIIDENKEITIIANYNNDAQGISEELNELGFNFIFIPRPPIVDSRHNYVLAAIASYVFDKNYSVYDLTDVLRIEQRKSIIVEIEKILNQLSNIVPIREGFSETDIKPHFYEVISEFNNYLGIDFREEEIELLFKSVLTRTYESAFIKSDDEHKVMTVFGSKGLEFDQVISFSQYYNLNNHDQNNNHYVCVTRAKEKFIMFENNNESYTKTINTIAKKNNIFNFEHLYKYINHSNYC